MCADLWFLPESAVGDAIRLNDDLDVLTFLFDPLARDDLALLLFSRDSSIITVLTAFVGKIFGSLLLGWLYNACKLSL